MCEASKIFLEVVCTRSTLANKQSQAPVTLQKHIARGKLNFHARHIEPSPLSWECCLHVADLEHLCVLFVWICFVSQE